MIENNNTVAPYNTIEEIRMRKAILLKDIQNDSQRIDRQWHSLFHKPNGLSKSSTPSKRINSFMNMGAGFLDGALLVWKLYRKFKK